MVSIVTLIILFLWQIAPIILAVFLLLAYTENNRLKKMLKEYQNNITMPSQVQQSESIIAVSVSTNDISNINTSMSQLNSMPISTQKKSICSLKEQLPTGSTLMFAGVVMILLATAIFGTTTWNHLSNNIKIILLFMLSPFFMGVSVLSFKKFKLKMTSIAFYHIGSATLPIAIFVSAFIGLFGPEFLLNSVGVWKINLLASSCFLILNFIGYKIFKGKIFYLTSIVSGGYATYMLTQSIGLDYRVGIFLLSLYGLIIITFESFRGSKVINFHSLFSVLCMGSFINIFSFNINTKLLVIGFCCMGLHCIYQYLGKSINTAFSNSLTKRLFIYRGIFCIFIANF
ncbi:MAG: hypothetical protein ACK5L6_11060 [Anaerorhabdus sp.]|uniref:hypothetical protein n=1 Tax=Anaerorhabdus sp. TaxID=1872524 RepID=UPI003A8AA400